MSFLNTLSYYLSSLYLQPAWFFYLGVFLVIYPPVKEHLGRWTFATMLTVSLIVCYTIARLCYK